MVKVKIHMKLYLETLFDTLNTSCAENSGLWKLDFVSVGVWFPVSQRIIAPSSAGNALEFEATMILLEHQEPHAQRHSITVWKS